MFLADLKKIAERLNNNPDLEEEALSDIDLLFWTINSFELKLKVYIEKQDATKRSIYVSDKIVAETILKEILEL